MTRRAAGTGSREAVGEVGVHRGAPGRGRSSIPPTWGLATATTLALAVLAPGCAPAPPASSIASPGAIGGSGGAPRNVAVTPPPAAPSAWRLAAGPSPPGATGAELHAVACSGSDDCWAVGFSFGPSLDALSTGSGGSGAAPVPQTLVEHESGGGWAVVAAPTPAGATQVSLDGVACASADDCWAVGFYAGTGPYNRALAMQYTGAGWHLVDVPSPEDGTDAQLRAVACVSAADCWAVGFWGQEGATGYSLHPLVEEYTGGGWNVVAGPEPAGDTGGQLQAVTCDDAGGCWSVGYAGILDGTTRSLIEELSGGSWRIVASLGRGAGEVPTSLEGVSCIGSGDCWAVGSSGPGTTGSSLIEEGEGGDWTVAAGPTPPAAPEGWLDELSAVSCTGSAGCWAVGSLESPAPDAAEFPEIDQETSTGWRAVAGPALPEGSSSQLSGVSCTGPDACWAVGYSAPAGGAYQPLLERET